MKTKIPASKKDRYTQIIASIVLLAFVIFGLSKCFNNTTDVNEPDSRFKQVTYYKSKDKHRFFVYEVTEGVSIEEMKEHAKNLMHTMGSSTNAAYYSVFHGKRLEFAKNMDEAQQLGFQNGCILGYWHYTDGKETFMEYPKFD